LFHTPEYTYRVFVTNLDAPLDALVGFYRGRATAENLIKEANNDAGLAAKIWRHAGRVGVSYSDHYQEKGLFERLMNRLRSIMASAGGFRPVITSALRC